MNDGFWEYYSYLKNERGWNRKQIQDEFDRLMQDMKEQMDEDEDCEKDFQNLIENPNRMMIIKGGNSR